MDRKKYNRERMQVWRKANPERAKAAYKRSDANRKANPVSMGKRRKSHMAYYFRHRERKMAELRKRWSEKDPDDIRDYNLRYTHGITLDDVKAKEKAQDGKCAICGRKDKKLVVDHDHNTNVIRDLLCNMCNAALGMMREDAKAVIGMLEYIYKWKRGE